MPVTLTLFFCISLSSKCHLLFDICTHLWQHYFVMAVRRISRPFATSTPSLSLGWYKERKRERVWSMPNDEYAIQCACQMAFNIVKMKSNNSVEIDHRPKSFSSSYKSDLSAKRRETSREKELKERINVRSKLLQVTQITERKRKSKRKTKKNMRKIKTSWCQWIALSVWEHESMWFSAMP